MTALLLKLKAYGWLILGAVLTVGAFFVRLKVVTYQRDKARYRAKVAEAGIERKAETEEREAEIHQEWSDYENRAKQNLEVVPDILSKPRNR